MPYVEPVETYQKEGVYSISGARMLREFQLGIMDLSLTIPDDFNIDATSYKILDTMIDK